jgi:hypothetical protein
VKSQTEKTKKVKPKSKTLPAALKVKTKKQDTHVTIEVVCLEDMPLLERHKEANKPLYLTRYE